MRAPRLNPLYVTRPIAPDSEIFAKSTNDIFDRGIYSNFGTIEQTLTARLKERYGCDKVLLFNNGTIALLTALLALPVKRGTFITSPFTFPATVHCIKLAGFDVKFVDVDKETLNIDPREIAKACDENTVGILAVHVYGNPCDTNAIQAICQERGLFEIYDAAHCFDVFECGQSVFCKGAISVASLHATKLMHTGEGGALFFSDAGLMQQARQAMNFGIQGEDHIGGLGLNGKMSEINAATGLAVLPRVNQEIAIRKEIHDSYMEALREIEGLRFPVFREGVVRNHQYFPVMIENTKGATRNAVWSALRARNIYARKYFYPLLSDCEPYVSESDRYAHPVAAKASQGALCLPIHSEVTPDDVREIADVIKDLATKEI